MKHMMWVFLWVPWISFAEAPLFYTGSFSSTAVGGYDVVSYFQGGPKKGDRDFETSYGGVSWRFSTQENLTLFLANPEAYVPQYGGYCAYAVSRGYTAKGDPLEWSLVDNKLYLNYNAQVKRTWETDIPGNIKKGDANWPKVLE